MGKTVPYSRFLSRVAGLIGVSIDDMPTNVAEMLNGGFNTAIQSMWTLGPWQDICPRGEARFLGNRLTYGNNVAQSSAWTANAVTPTANIVANPADGLVTGSRVMETAANAAHNVTQTVATFYPNTNFTVSCYARPNGRDWIRLAANDGVTTYSAFFNILTGTVGTISNALTATIGQQPNGFWLCQITLTANAAATTSGSYTVSLSTDGSTLSYAGNTGLGVYLWGNLVQQTSLVPVQDSVLPWEQTGQNTIDALFDAWLTSPFTSNYPRRAGYELTQTGIQVINGAPYNYSWYMNGIAQSSVYGSTPANPIFIYYRKMCPNYEGDVYSASETYAVNDQVYFTSADGTADFWKCIVATTAGQSPTTTPNSWEKLTISDVFFHYTVYYAYADWLASDGQPEKAAAMYAMAENKMNDEFDKRERQEGDVLPMKVATHLTSRPAY